MMAGEVIDLLSSSPSARPSPQDHPPATSLPSVQKEATAKRSTYSDGVFDLTSESHAPVISENSQGNHPKNLNDGTAKGMLVFSDDFDSTCDFDKSRESDRSLKENTGHGNKRRRISPTLDGPRSSRRLSSATNDMNSPAVLQPAGGLRRTRALDDPIEFSSSPRGPYQPTSAQSHKDDVDDPFASTPAAPQPSEAQSKKPLAEPASSDPFASDPPVAAPTAKPVSTTVIDLDEDVVDPFASSPRKAPPTAPRAGIQRKATASPPLQQVSSKKPAEWDPISSSAPDSRRRDNETFSSSPPRPRLPKDKTQNDKAGKASEKGKATVVIDLSDSDTPTQGFSSKQQNKSRDDYDEDDELPDLEDIDFTKYRARRYRSSSPPVPRPTTSRTFSRTASLPNPRSKKSAEDKTREKEARAAEKEREKERKKQEREAAKERKAQEKARAAALAEVNKVRTDKKVSTPEMIVDLPSSLPSTVALQTTALLRDLDVECTTWQSPGGDLNAVKWRRKVRSRFNDDLGMWEPISPRIEEEPLVLVILTASEFVELALAANSGEEGEEKTLGGHVRRTRRHFPTQQTVYVIEGLTPWMRKNRNVRNRQFVSAVRAQENSISHSGANPAAATATATSTDGSNNDAATANSGAPRRQRRAQQPPPQYIDEDTVEDALLELQVLHGVQIHHTSAAVETAQWLAAFTQHASTAPYRRQKETANAEGAGFCMESGQVRAGDGPRDTYVRMLQEIVRVTAPIAYGVAAEFGTARELVRGFEAGGPLALEACRKSANRDGAPSDRAVGQAVSRRLCKVFTGRDEMSTDV